MPCGKCGSKKRTPIKAPTPDAVTEAQTTVVDGYSMVLLEYTGTSRGPYRINGDPPTNGRYRFGLNEAHKFGYVYPHDVKKFLLKSNQDKSPVFRVVKAKAPKEEEVATPQDFVGQAVEETPESKPEIEHTEPFIFDIEIGNLTVRDLQTLMKDARYLRREILSVLIDQEIRGKNRKTTLEILRTEIDKLP